MFVHTQKLARIIKFNDQRIHKCILLVLVPCTAVSVQTIEPNKMILVTVDYIHNNIIYMFGDCICCPSRRRNLSKG